MHGFHSNLPCGNRIDGYRSASEYVVVNVEITML